MIAKKTQLNVTIGVRLPSCLLASGLRHTMQSECLPAFIAIVQLNSVALSLFENRKSWALFVGMRREGNDVDSLFQWLRDRRKVRFDKSIFLTHPSSFNRSRWCSIKIWCLFICTKSLLMIVSITVVRFCFLIETWFWLRGNRRAWCDAI